MACECVPSHMHGYEYVQFIGTAFGVCAYTPRDIIGFILGLLNIVLWLFAQVPQLITNYRNKTAESLSISFLSAWLLGDVTNLIGCICTNQTKVQLFTSVYFMIMDVLILSQWVYYRHMNSKNAEKALESVAGSTGELANIVLAIEESPKAIEKSQHIINSPAPKTPNIARDSPLVTPILAPLDAPPGSPAAPRSMSLSGRGRGGSTSTNTSTSSRRVPIMLFALVTVLQQVIMPSPVTTTVANGVSSVFMNLHDTISTTSVAVPTPTGVHISHPSFTTTTTTSSVDAVSLDTTTPVMFASDIMMMNNLDEGSIDECDSSPDISHGAYVVGVVSAWISGTLYFTARIPQIILNKKRQSVEGLSLGLFLASTMANFFYAISILLPNTAELSGNHFWATTVAYLVGSLVTNVLSIIILTQFWYYNKRNNGAVAKSAHHEYEPREFKESGDHEQDDETSTSTDDSADKIRSGKGKLAKNDDLQRTSSAYDPSGQEQQHIVRTNGQTPVLTIANHVPMASTAEEDEDTEL